MSGSNPFDDLAGDDEDDLDTDDEDERYSESNEVSGRGRAKRDAPARTNRSDSSSESPIDGPDLASSSPPFPYSDAQQKQLYVEDGLWDEFQDLGFDAEIVLRREFDVRNVEQRELDTAVIRLVLEELSDREIAEMVVAMRGFDPENQG